jgi:prepilin-type N-terminal cleavage/methylation domain-containing protein
MDAVRRATRQRGRRAGGFTLLEIMITLTVVAIGLMAMMMMQVQAMKDGSRGRHRTGAAMIARDQIERIQNMPFSDSALDVMDPLTWTTPAWLDNGSDASLDPGEVPVAVSQAGGSVRDIVYDVAYLVGADDPGDPNPDLRRVDLEVIWDEEGISNNRPTRTGRPTVAVSTVLVDNDR